MRRRLRKSPACPSPTCPPRSIGSNRFSSGSSMRAVVMANEHDPDRSTPFPVGDIGQMWRQQTGRHDVRSDEIRSKARAFDGRVQRWNLVGGLTFALLIVKNVWEVAVDVDVFERSGDALLLAGLLYVAYRFIRHARATARPAALGETTCVEIGRAHV